MTPTADVAIIGGGVIGLSIAFHLLQNAPGLNVAVVDTGLISGSDRGQASYAAAGMLAPFAESQGAGPFVRLGVESLARYPAFVDAVREAAGVEGDPLLAITGPGMLRVTRTPEDADRLDELFAWQRGLGFGIERMTGDEARQLEPYLAPEIQAAIFSPRERQIDPRRLTRSLHAACRRLGAVFYGSSQVTGIQPDRQGGGYTITAGATAVACGSLVVAGGAWSRAIACGLGVTLPIKPVKGQILALRAPLSTLQPPLRHTIYASNVYLVPRPEGRIIVGATEEPDAGFSITTNLATVALNYAAIELVPSLSAAPPDGRPWAGLRPASPDGLPILGLLPGHPNAFVATGHFRNGILLTPITGELIAHEILDGTPHPLRAVEFSPERFAP